MERFFTLEIGGIRIRLDFAPGHGARSFVVDSSSAHLTIESSFAPTEHRDLPIVFASGGLWKLYGEDGRHRFEFVSPLFGERPYRVATVSEDWSHANVLVDASLRGRISDPLEYPLDELLFLNLVNRLGGLEVHACGVSIEGRGLLFVGHSGAGKSTLAELCLEQYPDAKVLSDDRIIVRQDPSGRLVMWGTPWHGEARLSAAASAPLDRVFILRQAERNELRRLPAAAGLAELLSRCFYPLYDPGSAERAAEFAVTVVESVPVFELSFRPDSGAVEEVLSC